MSRQLACRGSAAPDFVNSGAILPDETYAEQLFGADIRIKKAAARNRGENISTRKRRYSRFKADTLFALRKFGGYLADLILGEQQRNIARIKFVPAEGDTGFNTGYRLPKKVSKRYGAQLNS